jgi:uncharacterized protein (UPF0335 family)
MPKKEKSGPLSEGKLKSAIERLYQIKSEKDDLDAEFEEVAATVLATLDPKDVRQYGQLRCTIMQNMNRGISWKKEWTAVARKLYPTAKAFRAYLVDIVKRHPKKPGKAFTKITWIKTADEVVSQ